MLIRCGRGSWVTFVHLFVILVIVLWCIINTRKFFELEKTEKKGKREKMMEKTKTLMKMLIITDDNSEDDHRMIKIINHDDDGE